MRAAARAVVFDKAMRLRNIDVAVGDVVTLALNDSQRLLDMGMVRGLVHTCCSQGLRTALLHLNDVLHVVCASLCCPTHQYCVFSFLGPIAIVVVLGVLLYVIGVSILAGYGVMFIFFPLQRFVSSAMGRVSAVLTPVPRPSSVRHASPPPSPLPLSLEPRAPCRMCTRPL
jgi:hypothetical protein